MQLPPVAHAPSEVHYTVAQQHYSQSRLLHPLNSVAEKVIQLNPQLILGGYNLYNYDSTNHSLVLTPAFHELLVFLVKQNELDKKALHAGSLNELNDILQQPQGAGGVMRKNGVERWDLDDTPKNQQNRDTFATLFQQLGFTDPRTIEDDMTVDHCIVFGSGAQRMEARIKETLVYLQKNLQVTGHVFLLSANRELTASEIDYLHTKTEALEELERGFWNTVFEDPELSTEANAFVFLWKCTVPHDLQASLNMVGIDSSRIGNSFNQKHGYRATTEVTIEDWMEYYKPEEPQCIFALAENPYIRMADQLRLTVLTNAQKADVDQLIERVRNTTLYVASPNIGSTPLISILLDEIGRNVYRTVKTLEYLDGLEASASL